MTNVDGENRLFVCPMWQDGLLTMLFCENIKRRLQILGARTTREQGHLPFTRRQMRRLEAGLHQANLLNVSGTLFGGRSHT